MAAVTAEASAAERFQVALGLSPVFARLLAARGWREISALTEFLYPRLEHTHSPWLMLGMEAAVTRILAAIAAGEPIRILGDYDADGTLATVILRQALQSLGAQVSYQLPQRLGGGYGLSLAMIEQARAAGVGLVITVDTGIRELEPLARARELGLDVIVTDHHLPGPDLPVALAILNPHQPDCRYPDKGLCGSGVAFKLVHALLERGGKLEQPWPPALRSYLKLLGIATVADAMPLLGENRVLVRFGLQGLTEPVNPGLRALLQLAMAGRPNATAPTARDAAFRLAPRLNAAGRMGRAEQVVELFFSPPAAAAEAAQALEALNTQRRQVCDQIQAACEAQLELATALPPGVLVLAGEGWHRGVLGIVASRVMERTGRPVLMLSLEDGWAYGSGRAPTGWHLLEQLDACRDLFLRYGGHAQAVGCTLAADRLTELRRRLQAEPPGPPYAPLPDTFAIALPEITPAFARDLLRLEPCGEANPDPQFLARGVRLATPPQRLKDAHAKLVLEQDGVRHTALFWNLWRNGEYQHAPLRPLWNELVPGLRLDARFRVVLDAHPQYGERLQLILNDFFVTPAAAATSH
ncbi:MAG: single-stranded-DNA-specific exonuclease RecJ [Terriglobales bacterium]